MQTDDEEAPTGKHFLAFLLSMESGQLVRDCEAKLREVVKAVQAEGEKSQKNVKGELSLAVTVTYTDGIVAVRAGVSRKIPERTRPRAVYFANNNGDLVTQDPRQLNMLDPVKQETRDVLSIHTRDGKSRAAGE